MRGAILCPICHQSQRACTHHHGRAYTVVNLATHERGTFTTAHDVAMYMWGRDFERYAIFKNGVVFEWQDGDLRAFEKAIEAI
jgi:hypothetical protein